MPDDARLHLAYFGNGQSYHVHKWLPALAEQGLRVSLFTFHPPAVPLEGVEVGVLRPAFHDSAERMTWIDFAASARPLRRLLREREVDVLMPSYATSYGWMGLRTGFDPIIVNTWTYDVSVYPFEGLRRVLFRPLVGRVLRRARAVLTDGGALADFVRTHYRLPREKVVPALWGIRLADYPFTPGLRAEARAARGIPPEAPVVISARGVSDWYAPAQVLPAFRRLLDARPDAHVIVLTLEHERSAETQAALDILASHPRAHVVDRFLTKPEMCAAWAAADVLVSVPPHDGISAGILEGMYAGAIPVVSDIPSNRSFLEAGRNAFFVSTDEAGELAETLLRVLADLPALKAEVAPRNRAWVREHASVESTARQVAALVRRVAAERGTS
ncbi:glycosyltransferase family 4 protein [Rhodocaloribacter sp.]